VKLSSLLRKLVSLDRRDRFPLVPATLCLLVARTRLRLQPFRKVLKWADRPVERAAASQPVAPEIERRIRAVERAGHWLFPGNPCLTQAVVVHRLLRGRGHASQLRIGVRKPAGKILEAHAWVELGGDVVMGARGLSADHVPLPTLGATGAAPEATGANRERDG
jgi:hypothetical protein